MIRSLRKGRISVFVQHEHTGNTIGAEKFETEIVDGKIVLRLSFRPVDGNQKLDEEYFREHSLKYLDVDDSVVIQGLEAYARAHREEFTSCQLEVISRGRRFVFSITPNYQSQHEREVLRMVVEEPDG